MEKTKTKPKTLAELYDEEKAKPTAAQQFISNAAAALGVTEQTVRMWICGASTPSRFLIEKIEQHFGQPIETLFPNAKYDKK